MSRYKLCKTAAEGPRPQACLNSVSTQKCSWASRRDRHTDRSLWFAAAAKLLQSCLTLCDPIDGRQPTRLPRPWDSPGKNTGVGCHFLLQCMKVKSESEVAQLCPTLSDPMDYSPPGPLSMGFSRQEYWSGVPLP